MHTNKQMMCTGKLARSCMLFTLGLKLSITVSENMFVEVNKVVLLLFCCRYHHHHHLHILFLGRTSTDFLCIKSVRQNIKILHCHICNC
jgi:hypothetical protein